MRVTVTIEKPEQFQPVIDSGRAELILIDSGYFEPSDFSELITKAHENGCRIGLRMPQIFRERAEKYFLQHKDTIGSAGFDLILYRNFEELFFAGEEGLLGEGCPKAALDHTIYLNNTAAMELAEELLSGYSERIDFCTLPLEWNLAELCDIRSKWERELVIYGRVPMMVTAQCVKKTTGSCDHIMEDLTLVDRTGALLPVKNCCRFCCNTIYNSVPTWIGDMEKELLRLKPERIRYEFTTETANEVNKILMGEAPTAGSYTRGHGKKSVD